ncbi:MAG: hypothetical protein A2Y40_10970 [Candidatus Margulisbacteria bacterium GWF2_35_9]|nr:MAG: hypothetical protein A2Y40_10970 [Candidatus Margulisbacteria bacterium GWF2_35_9]
MKILIVDDDPIVREILNQMLKPYGECTKIDSGAKAFVEYTNSIKSGSPYKLILLDIVMHFNNNDFLDSFSDQNMDGILLLDKIRKLEDEHHIPAEDRAYIFMVTSRNDEETIKMAKHYGCNEYITKPLDKTHLASLLQKIK